MTLISIQPRTSKTGFEHVASLQIQPQFLAYMR